MTIKGKPDLSSCMAELDKSIFPLESLVVANAPLEITAANKA
jgi:hypothetical protein